MTNEIIDITDENNKLLGVTSSMDAAHQRGLWHRTAHVWIYNSEVLLQLRKIPPAGVWDASAAGHLRAGETPEQGALRESLEETGLSLKELEFIGIRKTQTKRFGKINNEHAYVYLSRFEGSVEQLRPQKEEVHQLRFFPINFLKKDIKANPDKYVAHGSYWFEILDEIESRI